MQKLQSSPVVGFDRCSNLDVGVSAEPLGALFTQISEATRPASRLTVPNQLEAVKWLDFNDAEHVH